MHEFPITQQIIKIAEEHAKGSDAAKVTKITLVVGEMSGFIGDSISMYFNIISKGSLTEGAVLDIKYVKPKLKCEKCGEYFERKRFSFECPACGGQGVPTEIGKEFYIESIEVEDN